ncbi:MAG: radical SAM family heme chaperone HemW [Clostridia bacterium]|nr:radical SAM family heme chaperone HemW [Clostridia bacterium]MBQ7106102.1 radical SAM family heme chaperone HemW [Clostridia bacterium]
MTNSFGIYIHIPFCRTKCNYCSFYSLNVSEELQQAYCDKTISEITRRGRQIARPVCSVYIGGGTPSVLSGEQISSLMRAVKDSFTVTEDAEITVEINPGDDLSGFLEEIRNAGCNRLSMGVQSGNDDELLVLGRRHSVYDAEQTFYTARKLGFDNISLDLMLGLPDSTKETLNKSIDFVLNLAPEHISAYILKIEDGTPFGKAKLNLPNDDDTADQYLLLCDRLKTAGYTHYEISNFAKLGYEGKHNLNYWRCREYLGFGPAAHSFFEGERFYYPNDITAYMQNCKALSDGEGGNEQEYIMLSLRISDGIDISEFESKFLKPFPPTILNKARLFEKNGLCITDGNTIRLTDEGMLVSNSIITSFTEEL